MNFHFIFAINCFKIFSMFATLVSIGFAPAVGFLSGTVVGPANGSLGSGASGAAVGPANGSLGSGALIFLL